MIKDKIYFIQEGEAGPIKIGVAKRIAPRLCQLQCGNHRTLRLLTWMNGSYDKEKWLHRRFAKDRMGGEWFSPSQALDAYIAGVRARTKNIGKEPRRIGRIANRRRLATPLEAQVKNRRLAHLLVA